MAEKILFQGFVRCKACGNLIKDGKALFDEDQVGKLNEFLWAYKSNLDPLWKECDKCGLTALVEKVGYRLECVEE